MAGMPQLNKANLTKVNAPKMMTMTQGFDKSITPGQGVLTPREYFKTYNVNPGQNLANKAPRRLSDDDIAATNYIDFRYVYTMGDEGLEWDAYHFRGAEGLYWQVANGQLYCAGIYWSQYTGSTYYLPVTIDYTTNEVTIPSGILLDDDTVQGNGNGSGSSWRRTDTVNYSILADAAWYTGQSEDFTDIPGTLYEDGSIEFSDELPYVFAGYQALVTYKRSGNAWSGYTYTVESSDTTYFEEYYVGTQFIVPNATHDYDLEATTTSHNTENVYMYQYDDTTAVVFNLYGMGMPGFEMNIYADGTMVMPLDWPVSEMSKLARDYYADYYGSAYNWDNTRWYWLYNVDEEGEATEDTVIIGTVEPTAIKWDRAAYVLPGIVRVSDGANMQLGSYPFTNNVLSFTDGSEFVFETVPVGLRGDVNNDGEVGIADVTVLIDHLLSGDFDDAEGFSGDNADCDLSGEITIGDVTALIDYLLTGNWAE